MLPNFKKLIIAIPILLKHFQKHVEKGTLSKLYFKNSIILILKSEKDTTRNENYRSISLMNIGTKILSKILAKQIQQNR